MIAKLVEKILCWFCPCYFEVSFCYPDVSKNRIEHFLTYDDAMCRIRECVQHSNETGLNLWVIDKYINMRPNFLVQVARWHKGEYINNNYKKEL